MGVSVTDLVFNTRVRTFFTKKMKIFCAEVLKYNVENLGDLLALMIQKCSKGASIAVCFHFGEFGFIFSHEQMKHL